VVTGRDDHEQVGDADSGQPRWGGRVGEKADESERAGDEKCGADKRKDVGRRWCSQRRTTAVTAKWSVR
jgi:hypothetical protein